jgi:cytochrome c556
MLLKFASGALLAVVVVGAASAQDPATIAKARHDHFKEIGKASKAMRDETMKSSPDIAVFLSNSKTIEDLARQIPTWFPPGTGRDVVPKSDALPVIWQKTDEFKRDASGLVSAAHAVDLAAQSGKLDAVKAALPALGEACKTCHTTFKAKDEH